MWGMEGTNRKDSTFWQLFRGTAAQIQGNRIEIIPHLRMSFIDATPRAPGLRFPGKRLA